MQLSIAKGKFVILAVAMRHRKLWRNIKNEKLKLNFHPQTKSSKLTI